MVNKQQPSEEADSRGPYRKMPRYYAQKMNTPLLAGTQHSGRLTCGPTKWTGTEGFVNLVNMNDSSSSDRMMAIQWPQCFFNLWCSCSSRPKQRRSCRMLLPPVAGYDAADEPVNPRTVVLPSAWETTAESSLPPYRSLPRPRRRPPPWCSRRGLVNVVNDRHASEVDCTWRGQQLGPRPQQGSASLLRGK